ncbi:hypothetical protein [Brevibacillus reuszeri]|uniref:hypothetical protein n=1 Tax=Brevibacillus reuszeri TaxID=54915 RepID=UPI000CCC7436|nr:hypothetical protein [Brevibacillus reuszeri]
MKKSIITTITVIGALFPISAFAAPADVSSTSNFTLTVVEETLGLTISGVTNHPEVIRSEKGNIEFNDIGIQNSGNTKGVLYWEVQEPTGIQWGWDDSQLLTVLLFGENGSHHQLTKSGTEQKLTQIMEGNDTDGDTTYIGPKERLKDLDVRWAVMGQLPIGEITVPIKWTMKAN